MRRLRHRRVGPADAELIWRWANDAETRRMSFTPDAIPWESHRTWFSQRLESPTCRWFIFEADGRPVGQVRFEISTSGDAEVDVSIAPEVRGLGYGRSILADATQALFTEVPAIRRAVAHVRLDNEPSLRAFVSAGFRKIAEPALHGLVVAELVREKPGVGIDGAAVSRAGR